MLAADNPRNHLTSASRAQRFGLFPNVDLYVDCVAQLDAHQRRIPMAVPECASNYVPSSSDLPPELALLESVRQGGSLWFKMRQGSVTASTLAVFLGLAEDNIAKFLCSRGVKFAGKTGRSRLNDAFINATTQRQEQQIATPIEAASAVAMRMGVAAEPAIALEYLKHYPGAIIGEAGVCHFTHIPVSVLTWGAAREKGTVNLARLPKMLVSPDAYMVCLHTDESD